ncbi:MFS transporter [Caulobacter segnis]|uniref:MFS transporter n=1 Tax=Caulobacter segnis TaxID=88688 RepID=UPI001CC03280|nr:MFS transporter [Caulobacter segnis]UAL10197.1 MFS transporter [Caulobacter segnis]
MARPIEKEPGPAPGAMTRLHGAVIVIAALALGVDLTEIALSGALATIFAAPPHAMSPTVIGWLSASTYLGAIVGAPLSGLAARRWGYTRVLAGSLVLISLTSVLCAISPDVTWLALARGLSGLALGALPPLIIAWLTELAPNGRRGAMITVTSALAYLGPPAALFWLRAASHDFHQSWEAWRVLFAVLGLASLALAPLLLWAPESADWLRGAGRGDRAMAQAERFSRSPVLAPPSPEARVIHSSRPAPGTREALVGLAILYFLLPWSSVGFPLLTGPVLLARGMNLNDSLYFVALAGFGPAIGGLLASFGVDRAPRATSLAILALAMLLFVAMFFGVSSRLAAGLAVVGFGVSGALYLPVVTLFGAELFAPRHRASATTLAWSINRLAAAVAPLLLLPLVKGGANWTVGGAILLSLGCTLGMLLVWRPGGAHQARKAEACVS